MGKSSVALKDLLKRAEVIFKEEEPYTPAVGALFLDLLQTLVAERVPDSGKPKWSEQEVDEEIYSLRAKLKAETERADVAEARYLLSAPGICKCTGTGATRSTMHSLCKFCEARARARMTLSRLGKTGQPV